MSPCICFRCRRRCRRNCGKRCTRRERRMTRGMRICWWICCGSIAASCGVCHPDSEATRRVQNLVEERRHLVEQKTAQSNRLTNHLKIYFPQMLEWFDRLDTELVCALLEQWPTLEELQKVPPARLRTFFRKQRCHYPEMVERRLVGIRQAMPAIRDRAVIEAKSAVVKVSVQVIRSLIRGVAELDRKIEEAAAAHPDFFIFESL